MLATSSLPSWGSYSLDCRIARKPPGRICGIVLGASSRVVFASSPVTERCAFVSERCFFKGLTFGGRKEHRVEVPRQEIPFS
jgi:hypothetical protein